MARQRETRGRGYPKTPGDPLNRRVGTTDDKAGMEIEKMKRIILFSQQSEGYE